MSLPLSMPSSSARQGVRAVPFADVQLCFGKRRERIGVIGRQRERLVIVGDCRLPEPKLAQRIGAIVEGVRIVGSNCNSARETVERIVVTVELGERKTPVIERENLLGIDC